MPVIRVLEVATFYTMYNLSPGRPLSRPGVRDDAVHAARSDDLLAACYKRGMSKGHTTEDGLFTLTEVECMGDCASAPMVQINDDNYEDLTADGSTRCSTRWRRAARPRPVRRSTGQTSCPGGPTSLKEMVRPTTITGGSGDGHQLSKSSCAASLSSCIAWKILKGILGLLVGLPSAA